MQATRGFPINIEQYIAAMRERFGPDARAEELYQGYYLPALNEAYQDGKTGELERLRDPDEEIAAFERVNGSVSGWCKQLITAFVHDLNVAYAQGRRDG